MTSPNANQPALFPQSFAMHSQSDPLSSRTPAFDAKASEAAKEAGMAQAAANKKSLLAYARKLAVEIGKRQAYVSADDVQAALANNGISIRALGNAAGRLFAGDEWEWTGMRKKSVRVHSHKNEIKVWRLRK